MMRPGDVVLVNFEGAVGLKRRPAVLVSTEAYNQSHLDIIVGVITTNTRITRTSADHTIVDWQHAGLNRPSVFRSFFNMVLPSDVRRIGSLSDADWRAVQQCLIHTFVST